MSKLVLSIAFTFIHLLCLCQQSAIVVERFEYMSPRYSLEMSEKVNILSDKDVQQAIEKIFKDAITRKWNIEPTDLNLKVKALPLFAANPKFNTKLKSSRPGTWYLFMQVYEDEFEFDRYNVGEPGTQFRAKCKMVDYKDSVVFERQLLMNINIENTGSTDVRLVKLLAHPQHLVRSFDIMARWLFGPEDVSQKEIWIRPAFVFMEKPLPSNPISSFQYKLADTTLCFGPEMNYCLLTSPMGTTQTGTQKNRVGNTAGSFLTTVTGMGTTKTKTYKYDADFSFKTDDSAVYHCKIPYAETFGAEVTREKTKNDDGSKSYSTNTGDYQLSQRLIDSLAEFAVTRGSDTVARFSIDYIISDNDFSSYTRMWDGVDTSTIVPLKKQWRNTRNRDDVIVQVKTATDFVLMKSSNEQTVKAFSVNEKPVLVIYGADTPSSAVLLQPVSKSDLVLFTILASLPYSYLNYRNY